MRRPTNYDGAQHKCLCTGDWGGSEHKFVDTSRGAWLDKKVKSVHRARQFGQDNARERNASGDYDAGKGEKR